MKKHFPFLVIVFLILIRPDIVKSQDAYSDVVYLKNGSIIHGIIIEQVPNTSIKILTGDENIFVYKIDEVEKMTREKSQKAKVEQPKSESVKPNKGKIKESGYTNITELNFGFGVRYYDGKNTYGIQTINGYLFNPYFSLGLGIGYDKYEKCSFLPLFVDLRANCLAKSITPFFSSAFGYSFGFDDYKGGFFLNPSIGVKFFVAPSAALNFSIGYRIQDYNYTYYYFGIPYESYTYTNKGTYTHFTIKFGATF